MLQPVARPTLKHGTGPRYDPPPVLNPSPPRSGPSGCRRGSVTPNQVFGPRERLLMFGILAYAALTLLGILSMIRLAVTQAGSGRGPGRY
jgi:hypothetical protein